MRSCHGAGFDPVVSFESDDYQTVQGLVAAGHKHGYTLSPSGPPAVPFIHFADDPSLRRQQRFCAEVTQSGAFFHPHHNWFMCAAHTDADIAATLQMADEALSTMRSPHGAV